LTPVLHAHPGCPLLARGHLLALGQHPGAGEIRTFFFFFFLAPLPSAKATKQCRPWISAIVARIWLKTALNHAPQQLALYGRQQAVLLVGNMLTR